MLLLLLLLSCWSIAGITAEDPPILHYRAINSSFCLHIKKSPRVNDMAWTFNEELIVLSKNVSSDFKDKVDYNPGNISLCIKKLTVSDSGIYEVSFVDGQKFVKKKHKLIVQETVPRPVIRMSPMHSNLSTGFCNITVNCSIQGDWVWSVCDEVSCRVSQRSLGKVNITVSAENRSVVCSGKNHVSTSSVSESIAVTCFKKSKRDEEETSRLPFVFVLVFVVVFAACACVFLCAFIGHTAKKHFSSKHNQAQMPSAQLTHSQQMEEQPQPLPRGSTTSSNEAEVSYENVPEQPSQITSLAASPSEELGSVRSPTVDTIYSFASACKSDSSNDEKVDMRMREASTSRCGTVEVADQPVQIDTVYSVLQKPKDMKPQHHQ